MTEERKFGTHVGASLEEYKERTKNLMKSRFPNATKEDLLCIDRAHTRSAVKNAAKDIQARMGGSNG